MATAACLPIAADRAGACVRTIFFEGLDLTGVTLALEMRLNPETPGAAAVALGMGATANAEGLRLIGVTTANGVPTSQVVIRLNESTMKDAAKVPYAGELGSASTLYYDLIGTFGQDKRRLCYGTFTALPTVYGMDGAPASRPLSGSAPAASGGTWNAARLTFTADEVTVKIDGADLFGTEIGKARAASAAALASSADAIAAAGQARAASDGLVITSSQFYPGGATQTMALGVIDKYGRPRAGFAGSGDLYAQRLSSPQGRGNWVMRVVNRYGRVGFAIDQLGALTGGISRYGYSFVVRNRYGRPAFAVDGDGEIWTKAGKLASASAVEVALVNGDAIRAWRSKAQGARFRGERASVICIGDSQFAMQAGLGQVSLPLAQRLRAVLGDAGPGWVSPESTVNPVLASAILGAGSWTTDRASPASPNLILYSTSSAGAVIGADYRGTDAITVLELHHGGGGATIDAVVDGAATQRITLDANPGKVLLPVPGVGAFAVRINLVSGTLRVAGFTMMKPTGVAVHNLGIAGTTAQGWASVDQVTWRQALARLSPDAAVVMLGGNDEVNNRSTAQFMADMQTLFATVRGIAPSVDIVTIVRAQTARAAGVVRRMADYAAAMRAAAPGLRIAMVDAAKLFGTDPAQYGYGGTVMSALEADNLHFNQLGRDIIASAPASLLLA